MIERGIAISIVQQVQAMVDLLVHIRWIYVSVIYSNTASDESGIEVFRWLAQNVGISIDMDLGIDDDITSNELFGLTGRVINEALINLVASTLYVSWFF